MNEQELKAKAEELQKAAGDDLQVVSGADMPPVLHMLLSVYFAAPEGARPYLDRALFDVLAVEVPRASMMYEFGQYGPVTDASSLKEDFLVAIEGDGERLLPPSIIEYGVQLAELIDKQMTNRLITAKNDDVINREAHLNIVHSHAQLLRGLMELTNVPDDFDGSSDAESNPTRN